MSNHNNNVWGNVYWNSKTQENSSNQPQGLFNNINMGNMQSGPFGSSGASWKSSGPTSLPLNTHNNNSNNICSGPGSWMKCGSSTSVWGSQGSSRSMSRDMSRTSSVSSQVWGEMMDGAILDEIKSAKNSPFSSLSYQVNTF